MPHHRHTHRAIPALALLLLSALLLAACGSSSSTTSASASSAGGAAGTSAATRASFRACLKAHGVTLPARRQGGGGPGGPPGGGGPGFFGGGGGGFARNPKLAAAFQACGGGRFPRRRVAISHATITRFVACVRQHGYHMPSPNFSGKGPVFPAKIRTDPKFRAASRGCTQLLFPGPPGGPRASTTPTT